LVTPLDELSSIDLLPGERLRVLATTGIVGDVVAQIAGDKVDLQVLLPPAADPHAYQATPRDLTLVSQAHVIFINGVGLELFLEDMLANAGGSAVIVSLSENITALPAEAHSDEDHAEEPGSLDPHVWLDPANVQMWVANCQSALAALDPMDAASFAAAADTYAAALQDLHDWIQAQVAQVPQSDRKLVADHVALAYFARQYGFEIVGAVIPSANTTADVSAGELAALQQAILASGVRAIFVAQGSNPVVAQRLADDLGLMLVPLYIGALSEAGGPADSYLDLMHYNVDAIVSALRR
jgi:ABC-type Zn uptake system ZnuABC Zn-binding protein ZnuA